MCREISLLLFDVCVGIVCLPVVEPVLLIIRITVSICSNKVLRKKTRSKRNHLRGFLLHLIKMKMPENLTGYAKFLLNINQMNII